MGAVNEDRAAASPTATASVHSARSASRTRTMAPPSPVSGSTPQHGTTAVGPSPPPPLDSDGGVFRGSPHRPDRFDLVDGEPRERGRRPQWAGWPPDQPGGSGPVGRPSPKLGPSSAPAEAERRGAE